MPSTNLRGRLAAAVKRPLTWIIAIPVLALLVAVVAPFVYINFIKEDADPRFTFEDLASASTTTTAASAGSETTTGDSADTTVADDALDGTWTVASGSQAGYRVGEVLFGQDTEATGRTSGVTGELVLDGTTVSSATITVDMQTVESDESRRDGQFHGRIMDTGTFPTATFTLTEPIELSTLPADGTEVTVTATGEFTIHGVTNPATFELTARRNGATIEVLGTIPVQFADYDIPDASGGPATVKDNGEIEFALAFTRASA
jgi:polyisoprenoid-binding protein YceI